jgi:hypothetical protein
MNPFQPSALLFSNQHPTLADDAELLQTDVMRFFAILCLCLMAIFALVKALPMAQPDDRPTIAEPTNLSAEARSLQIQIAALKKKLAATRTQVQAASRASEQASLQAKQAALERADDKVDQSRRREPQLPRKAADANPPQETNKAGYILRFASDAALQSLIAGGKVNFYAVAGRKAWQLRLTGGRPAYIASENPRQIYEMETTTVPAEYAAAFQRHVAAFGPGAVTWGVTLPAQTTASINRLIRGPKGGELVITPDGEVDLN